MEYLIDTVLDDTHLIPILFIVIITIIVIKILIIVFNIPIIITIITIIIIMRMTSIVIINLQHRWNEYLINIDTILDARYTQTTSVQKCDISIFSGNVSY